MIAGSSAVDIESLIRLLAPSSVPEATVLVHGTRLTAFHATWINGAMARAREMDDSHDVSAHHISVPLMPAALAAIELRDSVSGRDLLLAYALAADFGARLRLGSHHGPGESAFAGATYAPFSAAAVSAKLLGLKDGDMYNTLAWAYAQCAGALQLQQSGTSALHIQHGLATATGLQACLLARHGLPGPDDFLTGKFGFYFAYDGGPPDVDRMLDGLGERYEVTQVSMRWYPCGRVTHPPIEAAIALHSEENIQPDDIQDVSVIYSARAFRMTCEPESERRIPTTPQHAKFSLYYCVARALAKGRVGLGDFTADAVTDPVVRNICSKIRVEIDPSIRGKPGGDVTVTLKDGRKLRRLVPIPKGTPQRPCTYEEYAEKFRDCATFAAKLIPEQHVADTIDFIANLETAKNVREIVKLLT
jgi:2-methylcitrate dehydratase PrpD